MDAADVDEILGYEWRDLSGPLYRRLATAFREAIRRGELGPPTRVPSERDLARLLGLSRTTILSAYEVLKQEGLFESARGSGTRVSATRHGLLPGVATPSLRFSPGADTDVIDCTLSSMPEIDGVPDDLLIVTTREIRQLVADYVYEPLGLRMLREAIAARYTHHDLPTRPEEILITTGAQQAISLLFTLFGRDRGVLFVENPTYWGALDAARSVGASVLGIGMKRGSIDLSELADKLKRFSPRALYVMTTCHNPTGAILSNSQRAELAALGESTETPIIDDTTLSELIFDGDRPPWLAAIGRGTTITIGSLSKLYWPGLRVGWVRAPEALISRIARLKVVADLGTSHFNQVLATRLVQTADSFARSRRDELKKRFLLMSDCLRTQLPEWHFSAPRGGPFLWISLPRGDANAFERVASRHGVRVLPGSKVSIDGSIADHLRVSYVASGDDLTTAVERLRRAWESFIGGSSSAEALDVVV